MPNVAKEKLQWIVQGFDFRTVIASAVKGFRDGWNAYQAECVRFWKPLSFQDRVKNTVISYLCGMRQQQLTVIYEDHFTKAEVDEILASSPAHIGPIIVFRHPLQIQVQINPNQAPQPNGQTNGQSAPVEQPVAS